MFGKAAMMLDSKAGWMKKREKRNQEWTNWRAEGYLNHHHYPRMRGSVLDTSMEETCQVF